MPLQKCQIISIDSKRCNRFEINELLFDCRFLDTNSLHYRLQIVENRQKFHVGVHVKASKSRASTVIRKTSILVIVICAP